ncbi:Bacterial extracellular solute-binding protein [Corynebacterium mustelae]|uniref:Bacterial extracellular solute-binding protein n=1 Tax=Corynebacterium mustelae TaxID=571915 RepID=A0A0G3H120_9CORY|nr:Bacterial extracellular solute-binding protein [Corynebacterium mustelae]
MAFTKRKAFAAIMAATIGSVSLVACSDSSESTSSGGGDATGPVTLTVWTSQEDQTDNDAWLQTMQAKFEEANPDLDITWKNSVVSAADAADTVSQDPSAAADVYLFANDQLGSLLSSGAIGQLSDNGEKQLKEQTEENLANSVKHTDGNYYGLPYEPNTWFMYYDKSKLSEEDVKSFDTMLEKAKVSFPMSNSWYLGAFYAGAGATFFGADGLDESAGVQAGDKAAAVTKYLAEVVQNRTSSTMLMVPVWVHWVPMLTLCSPEHGMQRMLSRRSAITWVSPRFLPSSWMAKTCRSRHSLARRL